jgi:serine phosphatase RsbU (regulator of sigma subunit)
MPWRKDQTLVLSGDSGFFLMQTNIASGSAYRPFVTRRDTFLLNGGVLGCQWINDSIFAINSRTGVAFYDRDANYIEVINKSSGLSDGSVAAMFVDHQRNIWLMHNFGITKICYNSPMFFFSDQSGYSGTLEMIMRFHGLLFLATTEGLFEEIPQADKGNLSFRRIEEIPRTEVWDLNEVNGLLYISSTNGLYTYDGKYYKEISPYTTNRICTTPVPEEVVSLEKGGLSVFHTHNDRKPVAVRQYEFPGEDLIYAGPVAALPGDKRVTWCSDRFKHVVRLEFGVRDSSWSMQHYDTTNGLPLDQLYPVQIGDSIFFFTNDKAYRYVHSKDKQAGSVCFFEAKEVYQKIFDGHLSGLNQAFDSRLILERPDNPLISCIGENGNGHFNYVRIPVSYFLGGEIVQYVFPESNGILWVLSDGHVSRYNSSQRLLSDIPYHAVISEVSIGNDSVIFTGRGEMNHVRDEPFNYINNSITFRFASLFFAYDKPMQYFYQLDGYDTTWYFSKKLQEKSYTNLPEGTYTFRVKAENELGRFSEEASYTFVIRPPWYRTGWAYAAYGILFLSILFGSVRLGSRRIRKQKEKLEEIVTVRTAEVVLQKQKIETQNSELESAYKGIQDSIHYAERIQHAILPVSTEMENAFPDSFIFFRPRDIVSGDFYWMVKRGNQTWLACVDCTGHGVPGAFMSMIGNTLLNEIVLEKNIESPEKILDLLHVRVRQALRQDAGGETRDGMDISLCLIDRQKNELLFAGANRALWMIRNKELIVLSPDKYSIGGDQGDKERRFTLQRTDLVKGDCIYLSSDGYADQFGGPKGKKFMVKRFQQLLLDIHKLPMKQQGEAVEKAFDEWENRPEAEGNKKYDQVDDVLVIGFCIN